MNRVYLKNGELPFCKGCGHTLISENIDQALQRLNINLLDVIIVTDIGCHGIIDKCFETHTVHGLHGRSVALASGITLSLNNPNKKVIVFIGDGGATIGMQHIIEAAHKNFNMTVILHNNMLYGMTGGQPSDFTPAGFKTPTMPEGSKSTALDICELVSAAGASYVSRFLGLGNITDFLVEALSKPGFSFVEVMEICPSYAMKANPGMKLRTVAEDAGFHAKVYADRNLQGMQVDIKEDTKSLIQTEKTIPITYISDIKKPIRIMISGSASEGVQYASELFAKSGISAGLKVTKKGSYPVTVGVGFSTAEIILSPKKILYTGLSNPDYVLITSEDGLEYSKAIVSKMKSGTILIDSDLELPETEIKVIKHDFRKIVGAKNAAMYALLYLAKNENILPVEAVLGLLMESKVPSKVNWEEILK